MAEKAKTTKQNKKTGLIIGICAAIIVVIAIIIAVVVLAVNNNNKYSDSFFVSDGTKYVINFEADDLIEDEDGMKPDKVHVVYYYSGDSVTGITTYYQYANEETAEKAFTKFKSENQDYFEDIKLDGTFMITKSLKADYENFTASDVKQQIEFMESAKNSSPNADNLIEIDEDNPPLPLEETTESNISE